MAIAPTKIYLSAVTGLTPTLYFYDGLVLITTTTVVEIGTTGEYLGYVPNTLPAGDYNIIATVNAGAVKISAGEMIWNGYNETEEMINRLHEVRGLNPDSPATNTLTQLTAGSIVVDITGDLENTTTYTAEP